MFTEIKEALQRFCSGEVIIVVDDEKRENEGDFICSGVHAGPDVINFMAIEGRGLICAPLPPSYCDRLDLPPMVSENRSNQQTAFTVSIDAKVGISTGISAHDRARTIEILTKENSKASDFIRPGHIFPLRSHPKGILGRPGHTEAAVDLCRLSGHPPVGVICEIINDDGTMSRLPDLEARNKKWKLPLISIEQLSIYLQDPRHHNELRGFFTPHE